MAKSAPFTRIRGDVLRLTRGIPSGKVTTYAAIGAVLEVMPRHVAYLLATLKPAELEVIPWHRVVAEGGQIQSSARRSSDLQIALLESEGVRCENARVRDFDMVFNPMDTEGA